MKCSFCGTNLSIVKQETLGDEVLCFYKDTNTEEIRDVLICPFCGRLTEKGLEKLGSIDNALVYFFIINSYSLSKDKLEKLVNKGINYTLDFSLNRFLDTNHMKFEGRNLNHSCGYRLLSNFIIEDKSEFLEKLKSVLQSRQYNFCPCCGEKFKYNVDINDCDAHSVLEMVIDKLNKEK